MADDLRLFILRSVHSAGIYVRCFTLHDDDDDYDDSYMRQALRM